MALSYSNISVDLREISLKNRPQSLYNVSKKGTVPVLCINDKEVIDESLDIMLWSLSHKDNDSWMKKNIDNQIDMINYNDNDFKYWLDRYKYYDRYPDESRKFYRNKCDIFLIKLNELLQDNRFLMSDHLSLVDIAIFPFIRQFHYVDNNWLIEHYSYIFNWLEDLIKSKLFLSVMDKYPINNGESLIVNFNYK